MHGLPSGPSTWPSEAQTLWQRIRAHGFDVPGAALPFSLRLARDNGWSTAFAQRAIEEYRRFVFLAVVAGHPVTPSDEVDQVWHLHLVYTYDYWLVFCPDVLRQPLHHGPTRGGVAQGSLFEEQYSRTRHSYREWLGEHPPADLWPPAVVRFRPTARWVRVDRDVVHLVPRFGAALRRARSRLGPWRRRLLPFAVPICAGGSASAQDQRPSSLVDAGFDPYALSAPAFLWFYAIVGAASLLLTWAIARRRAEIGAMALQLPTVDAFEAAMLCDGRRRAIAVAATQLVDLGHARIAGDRFVAATPPGERVHPLARALYDLASRDFVHREALWKASSRLAEPLLALRDRLYAKGLLGDSAGTPRWPIWAGYVLPVAVAAPRIVAAEAHARPYGFLVALAFVWLLGHALLHAFVYRRRSKLTAVGRVVVGRLRSGTSAQWQTTDAGPLLATAVMGLPVLSGTPLGDLTSFAIAKERLDRSGGASCGAMGYGCGGGGGGCGGGSGCGGGGCGG